jgi:dihydropteroate synthase
VAEAALCAGASMINDISALCMDDLMGEVAARHKVPVILMHMKGTPRTMQVDPVYDDLMAEIIFFLRNTIARAHECGIEKHNIIVDPGIGFGKTGLHNLQIIRNLHLLETLQAPILIGPSRKAFIRKLLTAPDQKEPRPDSPQVEIGTHAAVAASVMNGAHIVRVHNVANARAVVDVLDAIRGASLRVK